MCLRSIVRGPNHLLTFHRKSPMSCLMSDPKIITLGCRLNSYESEVMRTLAAKAGLDDAVIVNTCAVTGEAVRQATQRIRRLRHDNPDARIVVTGCAAQIEPERFAGMDEVDHVIGNDEKMQPDTFRTIAGLAANTAGLSIGDTERVQVNDIMSVRETASHMIEGFGGRARAYVQVQNGCDHRCTFCIIPFGRGPSRSVPAGEVVAQIEKLVDNGYSEIVLTGVDITDYGADLPGEASLGLLCRQILQHVPELKRLRLSSIDQVETDKALLDVIADEPRLMPHLHLSLQAGDDMILKRMKRRHSRAESIRFCYDIRRLRPDVVFGADLIAGFPTESDEMFANTLALVEECGLTYLHVFPYSSRQGTPAARMPQVPRPLIKARAAQLREKGEELLRHYLVSQCGQMAQVLVERDNKGRTAHFSEIRLNQAYNAGEMVNARVTGHEDRQLIGEVVSQ